MGIEITKHSVLLTLSSSALTNNALVICNHAPPWGRAGNSSRNERGFDQCFATAVREKYPGFALYKQKWQ